MSLPNMLKSERGDGIGPIRFMAAADNYVMARRPGSAPFVEPLADWLKRPLESEAKPLREAYRSVLSSKGNKE